MTDLNTLGVLVLNSDPDVLASGQSCTSTLLAYILPNLRELRISLRLSLATYEELENAGKPTFSKSSVIFVWTELPLALEHLSRLKRLRIWLDHDEPCSWSVVNERAILSPLASLSNNPTLDVSFDLPKLHPKWETPGRHFTEDCSPLPINFHRRYRQRFHALKDRDGNLYEKYASDFPVLHEVAELDDTPMERLEEWEREMWERGDGPMEILREAIMAFQPTGHPW